MRRIYLVSAVLGTILPYLFLWQFLASYGFDIPLLIDQMFGTPIAAFFVLDVIITALVSWLFYFSEGRRLGIGDLWVYVLCTLIVGVSLALPLFLYAREDVLAKES